MVIISLPLGILMQSTVACGLAGAAFAGLHGRIPTFADFIQDIGVHVQAALCLLLTQGVTIVAALIAAAPGAALLVPGIINNNELLTIFGAVLMIVFMIPASLLALTLCFFTIPLVVDKKLDFWSALLTSVDCTRRDLLGLMVLTLSWTLINAIAAGCTCGIGTIFFAPWLYMVQARAYRDYFGLQQDRLGLQPVLNHDEPYEPHQYSAGAGYGGGRGYTASHFEEQEQAFQNYARDYYHAPAPPVPDATTQPPPVEPPPSPPPPPPPPPAAHEDDDTARK
jgi:hypothetical protein